MSQSTRNDRPKKPYRDFPLTPHASGAWQKKIRGRTHYFGKWAKRVSGKLERIKGDGWREALELFQAQRDDLFAGREPRANRGDALTVAGLCNHFLTSKLAKLQSKEITHRTFVEYREFCDLLVAAFGKTRRVDDLAAQDFATLRTTMTTRWGPVRVAKAITCVKGVFKFGIDNALIERAVRYGSEFAKPGKAVMRRHKAANGRKMLEAADCRRLIEAADVQLRAAILLGLNCGYGNHDIGRLPRAALNLEGQWADYPRPKTGIPRRCWLWVETVQAIRAALAARPEPKSEADAGLVFLSERGAALVRVTEKGRTDALTVGFSELLKALGLHSDGVSFYHLRHVHRTVSDGARDPVACDLMMGHADPSMGGHYRERIDDSRLKAVAEHVRAWLFGKPTADKPRATLLGLDATDEEIAAKLKGLYQGEPEPMQPERPRLRLYSEVG